MRRRLLSMLVIFALCFTLLPMQAMAEDAGGNDGSGGDAKTCMVSFDLNGHGDASQTPEQKTVASGSKIEAPDYPQVNQETEDGLYFLITGRLRILRNGTLAVIQWNRI